MHTSKSKPNNLINAEDGKTRQKIYINNVDSHTKESVTPMDKDSIIDNL